MGQSAIIAALAGKDADEIIAAMVGELIVAIPSDVDPLTWDERALGALGGPVWPAVAWQNQIWWRDPADTESEPDGVSVIQTLGGSRYKVENVQFGSSALSRTVTDPPDPDDPEPENRPQFGDEYIVPDGATGDWAGQEGRRAKYTSRGWVFRLGRTGEAVLVEDEGENGGYVHFNAADEWEDGLPGNLLSLSVRPSSLLIRAWTFENQTTTAPPEEGPAGEQYVIGASATGAWAGHDNKIAWRPATDAAFVVTEPFVGEEGYDKALGINIKWNGSAWVSAAGVWVDYKESRVAGVGTFTTTVTTPYAYSPTVAPTTAARRKDDNNTIIFKAKAANARLRLRWSAYLTWSSSAQAGTGPAVLAVFRDGEVNAIASKALAKNVDQLIGGEYAEEFLLAAPDASDHTYKVGILNAYFGGNQYFANTIHNSEITIEEKG